MLHLLNLASVDDLQEVLCFLGYNKKKSNDVLMLQMAIDNQAVHLLLQPQMSIPSQHSLCISLTYSGTTGELVSDGITLLNITFASETSAHAVTHQVTKLVAMEFLGDAMMSYANAELFMVDESMFPADTVACSYHLEAHSILVELMMGEAAPFAVAYQQFHL